MKRSFLLKYALIFFLGFILIRVLFHSFSFDQTGSEQQGGVTVLSALVLPVLSDSDYDWIGSRIYQNEALGKTENLTHWNQGEDFPSLGIGHFIWFPAGVDAPFDEQFPALVSFLRQQVPEGLQMPVWMQELDPFAAPWNTKESFDKARSSARMNDSRQWLDATRLYQAKFIVSAFEERWYELDLPAQQKQKLTGLLQSLFETPEGLFAVIDYYNFKGLGNNPRERYQQQGWGLVQVLDDMVGMGQSEDACGDILTQFRDAATGRLRQRVELSPPERNEARWLAGWSRRLDAYLDSETVTEKASACGAKTPDQL